MRRSGTGQRPPKGAITILVWGDIMGGQAQLSLFFCTLAFLLASCSNGSFSLYKSTRGGLIQSDFGQCTTSPYEGALGFTPKGLRFTTEDTRYFGKRMVLDHLRALNQTSGFATWLYIRNLGVPVSKVRENSQVKCQYFAFIPPSSSANENLWQDISSSSKNSGRLLGLYITILERSENHVVRISEQQIMVREDAHRWTLLHELGHHLFTANRVQTSPFFFDRELKEKLQNIKSKIRSLKRDLKSEFSQESEAHSLIKQWEEFFNLSHELHIRGPLEEFTLESLLLKEYMDGRLKFINDRIEPLNAVSYMSLSSHKVLLRYKALIQSMEDFRDENFKDEWGTSQVEIQLIINKIHQQIHFIEVKMNTANDFERSRRQSSQGRITQVPMSIHSPKHKQSPIIPHYNEALDQEHGQIYRDIF